MTAPRPRARPRPRPEVRPEHGVSILQAMSDKNIFGKHFEGPSWNAWRVFLAALFGLPLSQSYSTTYRDCTGREHPPTKPAREAALVIGRRGGKSLILALIAVYLATFRDWRKHLNAGERGTVMVICADRKQSRVIMRYVIGLLRGSPMLARLIVTQRAESIDLQGRVTIEVHTASFRSTRGYTIVAALCDEAAFWATDESSAEPDIEVLNALRPGMTTIPGSMLLLASSPYARRGALWEAYRRHYGKDGAPCFVWRAPTRVMNPTVPQAEIEAATERDPAHAAAEYGAEFRSDIESFVAREAVEACVSPGVRERAPLNSTRYQAFVDPSGGSADSMTLAIAHSQDGIAVLDAIREVRPPFSPQSVVSEFASLLRSYRITRITGDRYAGEWPREQFRKFGVQYEPSEKSKSDVYQALLPLFNSRKADLLDNDRLTNQLCSLERRTARGGRDSIDHPPQQHDDIANSVAGALIQCVGRVPMKITREILAKARQPASAFPNYSTLMARLQRPGVTFPTTGDAPITRIPVPTSPSGVADVAEFARSMRGKK